MKKLRLKKNIIELLIVLSLYIVIVGGIFVLGIRTKQIERNHVAWTK